MFGTAHVDSTVASMMFRLASPPSHSTIASPIAGPHPAAAMCSIARRAARNTLTQHRPRRGAWTDAPWHTRTAAPPGSPTSRYWKVVPVGRATPNEDENGGDRCTVYAA